MNGYNFTDNVRKVLQSSRTQAVRLGHEYVGTEHILLALLAAREGVAATVIDTMGQDRQVLASAVERLLRPGRGPSTATDLPYTSRAKKVLELAMVEARALGHQFVGTEHLVLGLLLEGKGVAAQVLVQYGFSLERVRDEVMRELGSDEPPAAPTPAHDHRSRWHVAMPPEPSRSHESSRSVLLISVVALLVAVAALIIAVGRR